MAAETHWARQIALLGGVKGGKGWVHRVDPSPRWVPRPSLQCNANTVYCQRLLGQGTGQGSAKALARQGFGCGSTYGLDKTFCVCQGISLPLCLCRMAMAEPCRGALCDLRSVRRGWKGQDYLFRDGFRTDVQSQSFDQGFPQGHAGAANSLNKQNLMLKHAVTLAKNSMLVLVCNGPKWSNIHQIYVQIGQTWE